MNKLISPKTTALVFGVLVLVFAVGFYIFAWTEPSQAPPAGNVETPLNVGPQAQTKQGNLTIQTTLYGDDILLGNTGGVVTAGGNLELYTSTGVLITELDEAGRFVIYDSTGAERIGMRGATGGGSLWMLEPGGASAVQLGYNPLVSDWVLELGGTSVRADGSVSSNLNADKLDDYEAADLLAQGGGGGGGTPYFFLTKTTYNGNLGGLSGADTKCDAYIPGAKFLRAGYYSGDIQSLGDSIISYDNAGNRDRGRVDQSLYDCSGWTSASSGAFGTVYNVIEDVNGQPTGIQGSLNDLCNTFWPLWCVVNLY